MKVGLKGNRIAKLVAESGKRLIHAFQNLGQEVKMVLIVFVVIGAAFALMKKPDLRKDHINGELISSEIAWQLAPQPWTGGSSAQITSSAIVWMESHYDTEEYYFLKGWAFLDKETDVRDDSLCVVLESTSGKRWILPAFRYGTQYVAGHFQAPTLAQAGFGISILKNNLPNGDYHIGLLFIRKANDSKFLHWLDQYTKIRKPTKPVTHAPPLTKTDGLKYGFYAFSDTLDYVVIECWAFFDQGRCRNCQSSFVLTSPDTTFEVTATATSRPDVANFFNDTSLINSGHEATFNKNLLEEGTYTLGMLMRDTTYQQEFYSEMDKVIMVAPHIVLPEPLEALPTGSDSIRAFIDEYVDDKGAIQIEGWAFINGLSTDSSETSLVLKSKHGFWTLKTTVLERLEIQNYFQLSYNVDLAGFHALFKKENLKTGKYEICLMINNKKTNVKSLQCLGNTIIIPWKFSLYGLEYWFVGLN